MMYRSLSTLLAFQAFNIAHAVLYQPSKQTSSVENTPDGINGWSPKPTQPPQMRGQARYGAVHMNELFKRQSSFVAATCGWISSDANQPLVCNSGYACAYLTEPAPQYFACCPTTAGNINFSECYYYSTCHNYNSQSAPSSFSGGEIVQSADPSDLWCAGNAPYCNTYFLSQSVGSTYQYLWCANTSTLIDVYDFTAPNSASASGSSSQTPSSQSSSSQTPSSHTSSSRPPSTSSYQSLHSSSTTPSSSLISSSPAAAGSTTGGDQSSPGLTFAGQSVSSTSTASPTAGGGGSKSNTGAIAGGVVGGVAGIALLGAAIGYLVYRKRKARVEPMREVSIYSNNYSSPGYSNNGASNHGYSNPNHANSYSQNY